MGPLPHYLETGHPLDPDRWLQSKRIQMKTNTALKFMDTPILPAQARMDKEASAPVRMARDFADISQVSLE